MPTEEIVVRLSRAEALVLFNWLTQEDKAERLAVSHPAERKVLWSLEAQLEKQVDELFSANYDLLVAAAREKVDRTTSG